MIEVGSIVTWQAEPITKPDGSVIQPMGVRHCRVLEIGKTEDGEPAAMIEALGEKVGARLADLVEES